MNANIPPGMEIIVGYNDGSTRTYRAGDSVIVEEGMRVLGAKTIPDFVPTSVVNKANGIDPALMPQIMTFGGLAWLLGSHYGPWSLIAFGIIANWARLIYTRARTLNEMKVKPNV